MAEWKKKLRNEREVRTRVRQLLFCKKSGESGEKQIFSPLKTENHTKSHLIKR